jgi:membrane protein
MAFTNIRLREAWNWGGLSFVELARRTWKAMDQHDTLNQATVIAFYAMLSLVPLLGFVLAAALGARSGVVDEILKLSAEFLPHEADVLVRNQIEKLQAASPVGILSFSAIVLLWSASSLFVAIMEMTSAAYGVRDQRPWWKRRLMALLLTLVEVVLLVGATVSAIAWPAILERLGLGSVAAATATIVQWVGVIVALFAAFEVAYYFGPHVEQRWEWITPGATLGMLVLIAASMGFRIYVYIGSSYSQAYGVLAGVVLMLLWLYLAALALLVGAEVNCVIEHAAPHGKAYGAKSEIESGPASISA